MADATFTGRFDDSEIERALLNLADQIDKTQAGFDELGAMGTKAFEEIDKAVQDADSEIKTYTKQLDQAAAKTKQAEQESGRFSRGLRTLFGNIQVGGASLNDYIDSLQTYKAGLSDVNNKQASAAGGAGNLAKGFGLLRLGVIGIVALIGGALVAAFTKFQKNADTLRVGLAQGKAALDVGITALGKWGNQIIAAATGQKSLGQAIRDARTETANFNTELRKRIELEGRLEKQLIDLERQEKVQRARTAIQAQEVERLNQTADNTRASFGARIGAAQGRASINRQSQEAELEVALKKIGNAAKFTGDQVARAKELIKGLNEGTLDFNKIAAQIDKNAGKTGKNISADSFTQADKVLALIEEAAGIQESLLSTQAEAQTQIQGIRDEATAFAEQKAKELADNQKRLTELIGVAKDAQAQLEDGGAVAQRVFEKAIEEVNRLEAEFIDLAKKTGNPELAKNAKAIFEPLRQIAQIDLERSQFGEAIEALPNALANINKAVTDLLAGETGDFVKSLTSRSFADRLQKAGSAAIRETTLKPIQQDKKDRSLSEDDLNSLVDQTFGLAQGAAVDFITGLYDLQIAKLDELISKRAEDVESARMALLEQEKLANQGYANDVVGARKTLEEKERAQREATARKLALEKKATKEQILINSAQQASELVLAAARLAGSGAKGGLPGLILALAGVGLIFRIVSTARQLAVADAQKTIPGFAKGTRYVDGPGTTTSDSVHVKLSKGERVLSARQNVEVGGRGISNEELVQYALMGQRVYDDPLLGYALELREKTEQIEQAKIEMQLQAYREAALEAAKYMASEQITYWKSRPVQYRNDEGELVRQWVEGNTIFRQIESQGGDNSEPEA